jgi:hypothetical protein
VSEHPPIPLTCAARPTVGGRVVPWINVRLADGGVDFRRQHTSKAQQALTAGLCQLCGTPLRHPAVLVGSPDSLRHLIFSEPPLHAECAVYASRACPMLAGQLEQYATGPSVAEGSRGRACFDPGCTCGGWTNHDPADRHDDTAPDAWYAVYASNYQLAATPDGDVFAAVLTPAQVLKTVLMSRPGAGRVWSTIPVGEVLADYHPPTSIEEVK